MFFPVDKQTSLRGRGGCESLFSHFVGGKQLELPGRFEHKGATRFILKINPSSRVKRRGREVYTQALAPEDFPRFCLRAGGNPGVGHEK
jgi:hypothetical protein